MGIVGNARVLEALTEVVEADGGEPAVKAPGNVLAIAEASIIVGGTQSKSVLEQHHNEDTPVG